MPASFSCREKSIYFGESASPSLLPDDPGSFGLSGDGASRFMGFVSCCQSGLSGLGRFHAGRGADGVFQEELLALSAQKEKFEDFCQDAFANFCGCGVVGTFYRAGYAQKAECVLELGQNLAFAIHKKSLIIAVRTEVGIFLVHVEIQLIAEGAVLFKGGKSIHRGLITAKGVPISRAGLLPFTDSRVPPKPQHLG